MTSSWLSCVGCGAAPEDRDPFPFRCPNTGSGDVDHVLVRHLDPSRVRFPAPDVDEPNPFARYRGLLHSYHRARAGGIDDGQFLSLVDRLDRSVGEVDGGGFRATALARSELLSTELGFSSQGGVWVKDETGNVAGSHKGRHLFGVLLHLEVSEQLGLSDPSARPDLAIASCGNAAVAAAVVARAEGRRLRVFVPVEADVGILDRLEHLGAEAVVCPRHPGGGGDPAYLGLQEALAHGAIPFTCQGNQNGLVIEGGETLAYEIVSAGTPFDHLVVQVGGGALASACCQSLEEATALGALDMVPRVHTVQTHGGHPLERAYHLVRRRLGDLAGPAQTDEGLRMAARHRSAYMWPWETEPRSIATGILDDETYDWVAVVAGMLRTGGEPLVVSEGRLVEANGLGQRAGYRVDPTGTAGLAGLLELRQAGRVAGDERVAVLFTGLQR